MFSLIKFHNEKYSIVNSKKVEKIVKKTCVAKYNGGKYSALIVAQNDEKSYLLDLKREKEGISKSPIKSKTENKKEIKSLCNADSSSTLPSSHSVLSQAKNSVTFSESLSQKKTTDAFSANIISPVVAPQKDTRVTPNKFTSPKNSNLKLRKNYDNLLPSKILDIATDAFHTTDISREDKILSSETVNTATDVFNENVKSPIHASEKTLVTPNVSMSPKICNFELSPKKMLDAINAKNIASIHMPQKVTLEIPNLLMSPKKVNLISSKNGDKLVVSFDQEQQRLPSETLNIATNANRDCKMLPSTTVKTATDGFNENIKSPIQTPEKTLVTPNILMSSKASNLQLCRNETSHDTNNNDKHIYSFNIDEIMIPSEIVNADADIKPLFETPDKEILETPNTSLEISLDTTFDKHNSTSLSNITSKPENSTYLSSVCIEESSVSEYLPESTTEVSKATLENSETSFKHNSIVDIIDQPLNIEEVVVPHSSNKAKKHFCIFCKKLQSKIARHLFLKHKKEKEIKKALILPKKSKERLKIIDDIRKKGDFLHNTNTTYNSGILIVSRQQQPKFKNKADDYVCCKNCRGFFSKRTLRIHVSSCVNNKNKRSNFIESRRITQYIHPVANNILKSKIFPVLRDDEISRSVRYDELILKFGNKLTDKHLEHQHDMIRANLRLLGRFKIEVKKLDPEISGLKDIFKPHLFDKCVEALRTVAKWDDLKGFKTPAVANNLTCLIKKCGKKQRAELIKEQREDLKSDLEDFLLLWEEEIPTLINKKAVEDQTNKKRDKKVVLPTKEDIQKLYLYLKGIIIKSMETLNNTFSMSSWEQLVQATLIFIQIFNRRRAGEIERLTIDNFINKEQITDNIDKDMLKSISKESIKFAKQFVRITLRGKLGRTVSVLLCPMCVKAIELVIKYRLEAGINGDNKYIFCKPSNSKLTKQYYRACLLLRKFSEECGAKIPESLRGTTLRKHIATHTSLLNVEDASVDRLANFMGHHKDIHKTIYRMSVPVAEITCVSKLLMAAIGDEEEVEDENIADEGNEDDENEDEENGGEENVDEDGVDKVNDEDYDIEKDNSDWYNNSLQKTQNSSSSSSRKRRSTSPYGKTKRIRWNQEEKDAIYSIFGDLKSLERLPSLQQCLEAIRQTSALNKRTPQQIKTWIDNQRRYKSD